MSIEREFRRRAYQANMRDRRRRSRCRKCGSRMLEKGFCIWVCPECGWEPLAQEKARSELIEAQKYRFELVQDSGKGMQKPIDLHPGNCHLQSDDNGITPIFIEHRFTKDICAGAYCEALDVFCYLYGSISPEITNDISGWFDNEEQGESWRCWERYPTQEERDAAPWKEL